MSHPTHPLHLIGGLSLWAIWFVITYGGLSVACRWQDDQADSLLSFTNPVLLLFSVVMILVLIRCMQRSWHAAREVKPGPSRFITTLAAALYAASALAVAAVALPLLRLPPCL